MVHLYPIDVLKHLNVSVPLKSILSPQFLLLLQVYFCIQFLFHLCILILHALYRS